MEKRVKIGKSILKELKNTTLTDTAIAESMGVTRFAIWKWRTGKSESMREINFRALAEALSLQVSFSKEGFAELEPKTPIIEKKGLEMTDSIGAVLVKTIDNLWMQLEEKDETIKELEAIINGLRQVSDSTD